jgi:hypothetical protein
MVLDEVNPVLADRFVPEERVARAIEMEGV